MNRNRADAEKLIAFIQKSPSVFHATSAAATALEENGFTRIEESDKWKLSPGSRNYILRNDSAIVAFVVGKNPPARTGFRILGSHTDFPCFKIKPNPMMKSEKSYVKLNTEVYGGPILSTWMDRPLSIAGRVITRSRKSQLQVQLVDFARPICIIPNLAIHMNREVNKGVELNRQVDTLPLLTLDEGSVQQDQLFSLVARQLKIKPEQVVDFDLFLYDPSPGCLVGLNEELVSAPRIDNLCSVHSSVMAVSGMQKPECTVVAVCFDNEEVGSSTRQGADSQMLATVLERINLAHGGGREEFFRALAISAILSVDGAHAVHPNRGEKCDPTSRAVLNGGPVIKFSANMSYTSDALSIASFKECCRKAGVPFQHFANRSDERGGSTIGPISSTHLDIKSLDVGIPMLSMHSIRELTGASDHEYIQRASTAFLEAESF